MWNRLILSIAVAAGLLACPIAAPARPVEEWPYDKLFEKADLVVFAYAVKTEAADDKPLESSWPYEFPAQNTTFKVNHALKGKVEGEQFKVLHYKVGKPKYDGLFINGPRFVTFHTKELIGDDGNVVFPPPEYLLFLKRLDDGRYKPLSGQIDPVDSVREVYRPDTRVDYHDRQDAKGEPPAAPEQD